MALSCASEVYHFIGGTFESAFDDPDVGPALTERPLRVRLGFVEPDCVLDIDTHRRQVMPGRTADVEPAALIAMTGEAANLCCQGRLDVRSALARGEIAVAGDVQPLWALVADGARLSRLYAAVVRRAGRADLLVD